MEIGEQENEKLRITIQLLQLKIEELENELWGVYTAFNDTF
jgi:hypothetical protein